MFGMYEFENSCFKCFFQSIICQMYHSLVDLLIGWRNRATPLAKIISNWSRRPDGMCLKAEFKNSGHLLFSSS